MAYEYAPVDGADIEAIGFFTFFALTTMMRLAKDGDQAPDAKAHIKHIHMLARAFELFKRLEAWAGYHGCDLHEAAGQYPGLHDDLDARTRPSTQSERSVKTYVILGITGGLLCEVNERHGLLNTNPDMWGLDQGDWECDHLAPQIGEDPQPVTCLSLWAYRVTGEALGLVRTTLFTHPVLMKEPDMTDEVVILVTKRHNEQMAQINLRA